ncbi:hypothetical protein ZWY2020_020483 [Hordeum vulgare]|nr:hypothetical protein ZWY2020_020483 [Hordeum vulgare]
MDDNLTWVPERMDGSTTRIDVECVRMLNLVIMGHKFGIQLGMTESCEADCVNFKDFSEELDEEIKHGLNQKLLITFWDKVSRSFAEINHDTLLLTAIDMYWDERKLPIMVSVVCKGDNSTSVCVPQLTTPLNPTDKPQQQQQPADNEHESAHSEHESSSSEEPPVLDDWVDAEVDRKRQLDLDSAAIHGMCTPTKQVASTIDENSPMTRSRKKQLGLDATMHKASKVVANPKAMKKTTRKLDVRKAKK